MYSCPSSINARLVVRMLRRSSDVWTSSNRIPDLASICPATRASSTPSSVSGVSVQPMKRLSRFQVLWPWRKKHNVNGVSEFRLVKARWPIFQTGARLQARACTMVFRCKDRGASRFDTLVTVADNVLSHCSEKRSHWGQLGHVSRLLMSCILRSTHAKAT